MELSCTGRGLHVTDDMRESAEHKLARLTRLEPRATRIELEFILEKNPRRAHLMRLEAAIDTPRKTFRAHAEGPDHAKALDLLAERLERQLRDHHEKRRARLLAGARSAANKLGLESPHAGPSDADTSEEVPRRTRGGRS